MTAVAGAERSRQSWSSFCLAGKTEHCALMKAPCGNPIHSASRRSPRTTKKSASPTRKEHTVTTRQPPVAANMTIVLEEVEKLPEATTGRPGFQAELVKAGVFEKLDATPNQWYLVARFDKRTSAQGKLKKLREIEGYAWEARSEGETSMLYGQKVDLG